MEQQRLRYWERQALDPQNRYYEVYTHVPGNPRVPIGWMKGCGTPEQENFPSIKGRKKVSEPKFIAAIGAWVFTLPY